MLVETVKVLVTLLIFIRASIEDLKTREIDDRIWLFMIALAIPLNVIQYIQEPFNLTFALIQFVLIFILANVMYYLLNFGGADCKALISLSIMFPIYPEIFEFTVKGFIFALSVLTDSVIFAPLISLYFFVRNALKGDFAKTMFIGYKVKIDEIPKFHNLLEWVENGKVVRSLRGIEFDSKVVEELKSLGVKEVWVTPALPFLVFMTFGFIVAVTLGDLIFLILNRIT
ncbi:Peptidase A24B, FlaK domain protein [Archaeoglobus profundus DSM 5631]|uniref:Peptidase A24B, FlaK domain protein n=1 Tax=Archaeoglobus profundus (strain DSM 5631 / JCM 9629 / NBRC 100127 / Av18) TaxID=572546 RepID=D2RGC2_ARCPA|nr:Peptidase A24B, FlaK domain protein [Archaeoglobus profundus DSM 5631]